MSARINAGWLAVLLISASSVGLAQGESIASEGAAETHDHAHEATEGTRLLVTDLDSTNVSVLDLMTGDVLGSFSTPGPAGSAYASPSGQYGMIVHRDENRVSVIHSGLRLEDHGDHADLVQGNPYVLNTLNVGREPTHYWAHGDDIAIFNDADGTVALLNERTFGLSLDYTEVTAAQPDHGAAVVLGDTVLAGYYELGRLDAYSREGDLLKSIEGCPGLHGEATLGDVAAFGCGDGVLLIRSNGGQVSSSKIANPAGTPEDVYVHTLRSHDDADVFVGNFGDGLAWIDPASETLEVVDLPSTPLRFEFDHEGEHVVVLTTDGTLHVLEADTGELHGSVSVMDAVDVSGGFGTYDAPSLAIADGRAYVGIPATGQIAEVHLDEVSIERELDFDGKPSSLVVLALEGGTIH